jgi:hypothetical protein
MRKRNLAPTAKTPSKKLITTVKNMVALTMIARDNDSDNLHSAT